MIVGLIVLGASTAFAAMMSNGSLSVLLLVAPVAVLVIGLAAHHGIRSITTVVTSFTRWHALILLLFVSGLVFRVRSTPAIWETPVDAYAGLRIVLVAATASILGVFLVLRRPDWMRSLFQGLVGLLALYALVSTVSAVWSVFPAWTLYKSLEYLVDVALFAAILAATRSAQAYKSLFDWILVLLGCLLLTVWVGAVVSPSVAWLPTHDLLGVRLAGVFPALDQNTVGECAAYLTIVAFSRFLSSSPGVGRAFYLAILTFGLITLVFSQTRAAIVGFLAAVLLILFLSRRRDLLAIFAVTLAVLLLTANVREFLLTLWQRGDTLEALHSFSGRLPTWQMAWNMLLERPLTGYGAYAGGRFAVARKLTDPTMGAVLSSYIEVMVGTSFWGLGPLLFALAGTWWYLLRSFSNPSHSNVERQLAVEAVGILAIITARSFFTVVLILHPALPLLAVLGYAEFLRRRKMLSWAFLPRNLSQTVHAVDAPAPAE